MGMILDDQVIDSVEGAGAIVLRDLDLSNSLIGDAELPLVVTDVLGKTRHDEGGEVVV